MLTPANLEHDSIFKKPKIKIAPDIVSSEYYRGIDIELTNHCNANCYFCPRDHVHHAGFMSEATFSAVIDRASEYPGNLMLFSCGHGESILHPRIGDFIQMARDRGLLYGLQTNGYLLTDHRRKLLLDSGINVINISASSTDNLYNDIYQLEFSVVLENVKCLLRESENRCDVGIYIVQTDLNKHLIPRYKEFWQDLGIKRIEVFPVVNRSGTIPHKNLIYSDASRLSDIDSIMEKNQFTNLCHAPVFGNFISWDGNYYLCSNDWEKKFPVGDVNSMSLVDALKIKIDMLSNNTASICNTCDWNIKNRIRDCLEYPDTGYMEKLLLARHQEEKNMETVLHDCFINPQASA